MTEAEVIKVLADLHTLHLANEPKDVNDLVYTWLAFFHDDDARIINKACYIYTKLRKKRFWPTPGDIEDLKQRAVWLLEIDDRNEAEALGGANNNKLTIKQSTPGLPPSAPAINIADHRVYFCDLCGLCDSKDQSQCPFDY